MLAVYDLAKNPPTYDFVTFLMRAERERLARREAGLAIEILPGPRDGFRVDKTWPQSGDMRRHLLNNIVAPMATLLPSCGRVTIHKDRPPELLQAWGTNDYKIAFRGFVDAYKTGLRPLRPSVRSRFQYSSAKDLVTITLREAEHWPERNSNVAQWRQVALHLEIAGYRVVVVRDSRRADDDLGGLKINPDASRHLEARASLYRAAALNLFVNNGPAWLAFALDAPALVFKFAVEGGHHLSSIRGRRRQGVILGEQFPGAPSYQRVIWADDTADVILDEVKKYFTAARVQEMQAGAAQIKAAV